MPRTKKLKLCVTGAMALGETTTSSLIRAKRETTALVSRASKSNCANIKQHPIGTADRSLQIVLAVLTSPSTTTGIRPVIGRISVPSLKSNADRLSVCLKALKDQLHKCRLQTMLWSSLTVKSRGHCKLQPAKKPMKVTRGPNFVGQSTSISTRISQTSREPLLLLV